MNEVSFDLETFAQDWFAMQAVEEERYRMCLDALEECKVKGVSEDTLTILKREMGLPK